jgi:uncharacterized protein (DUF952 family)
LRDLIVHLARRHEWEAALSTGAYAPSELAADGFIHMSRPEQAHLPANAIFSSQPDLVLLWIDAGRLAAELRYERVTDDGEAHVFPHLYGPLHLDAVVGVVPLDVWEPGSFTLPRAPE